MLIKNSCNLSFVMLKYLQEVRETSLFVLKRSENVNQIIEKVKIPIQKIVEENDLCLYNLEYLKEDGVYFLRVSIERKDKTMDFDTCSKISEKISSFLDEVDPIEHAYILEVCSPGAERPLKTKQDFDEALNQYVEVHLKQPIEKKDAFKGYLIAVEAASITIAYKDKTRDKTIQINFENIAEANLAVKI